MNLDKPDEKQTNLQQQALDIPASIPDMEKKSASKTEMEGKVTEANRLIEASEKINSGLKAASLEKTRKIKTQVIFIVVSLLVAVIAMQFIK